MIRLFGTSGIRGPAETLFNNQFCFDIGRTFAKFLDKYKEKGTIVVGMDPRRSSQRIKKYFGAGLKYEGRKVFDEGITPIPAMNYLLIVDPNLAGSAMVTGSHTRADLNGIKFFAFKEEILKNHEKKIEEIYQQLKEKVKPPLKSNELPKDARASRFYHEMLINLADVPYPCWKVIVDPGNGAQSVLIPKLLEELGLQVKSLNVNLKAPILTRDPEAQNLGEFVTFQEYVKKNRADFGLVYDSDGDRLTVVDDKGNFVPGDYIGSILGLESSTEVVVTPINTSQVVEYLGKRVERTKVGSPYVVAKMKETGAKFGFEANGGIFSSEIMMSRDGGSATIKLLNLLKKSGKKLRELTGELPQFYLFRTKVNCPWELVEKVIAEARKKFKGIKTETLDGVKIWTDKNTWILFRSSVNAPEFRVFAEAKELKRATELGQNGIELVKQVIRNEAVSA